MVPLFRPEQVRAMDERAFARGVDSLALMERAAGHLARTILAAGGRGYGLRVALLCGRGNNGGDGIAAARRLRAAGAAPAVCLVGGDSGLSRDAAAQLARWSAGGGRVTGDVAAALSGADVAVDCLLGTGARGEPRSPYREAIVALEEVARAGGATVVACDVPTGVDADTGAVADVAVSADVTLTLGAHKRGLWLWPARGRCGRLVLGDLGVVDRDDAPVAQVLQRGDVAALVPPPAADTHKRARGVVVVLAGSPGMTGAAALVARGAMGAGAGLVTVASSAAAIAQVAPSVPEALTAPLPDDPDAAFAALAEQVARADALAIGPGLGHADATVALVRRLVREVEVPLVLDADGLNAFRGDGDALADHRSPLLVVTPHAGELARLVRGSAEAAAEVAAQRVALVPERAAAWRAVVVAKGPGTLVAAPDGRVWINPTGAASLATGGTGDVLTGVAAALVAQQPDAASVAAAVWLHGRAGQLAGSGRAARAVTALGVADRLQAALEELDA